MRQERFFHTWRGILVVGGRSGGTACRLCKDASGKGDGWWGRSGRASHYAGL
jgi:hypothetical protein